MDSFASGSAPGVAPERHLAYAGQWLALGDRRRGRGGRDDLQDVEAQAVKHKSFAPWLVALVCFGPFAVALFIYYGPLGPRWLPQLPGSRELLAAPLPLPPDWRGAEPGGPAAAAGPPAPWQLIYARMTPCAQQCAQHLGRLLQVQLALGRDRDRVRRVVWHVGEPSAAR